MKTKISLKPKLRGKAAKIAKLNRSAAAKARWHRIRLRKLAHRHLIISGILLLFLVSAGTTAFAMAARLIPPPGVPIDIAAYEQIAAARRPPTVPPPDQTGVASWYAIGLRSPDSLTCASTKFPRGTNLQVTDLRNGHQMVCLVNDYGPTASTGRVLDLSRGSYSQLEGLGSGTMPVEIRVARPPT
jgi:hypothetical protein